MYCYNCGKEQTGSPGYCYNCGVKLVQESYVQPEEKNNGSVEYAGFWRRLVAFIIDEGLLFIIAIVLGIIIGIIVGINNETAEGERSIGIILADSDTWTTTDTAISYILQMTGVIIGWLYYAIMESSSRQATLGKMALGIIVTDTEGNRVSFGRATGRHFAKIISTLILLAGFIMIPFTAKKQGLHDMIASTLVVKK